MPWVTRGLVFGRLIVPDLRWVWAIASIFFLLNLLLNLLFDGPVRACASALRATPVSAFLTGLLVMLLAGPLCLLLAISVVGIAVIPFVIAALLLGAIVGRIGFARWLGMSVVHQEDLESRAAVAALVPDRLGDHVRRLRHPDDRAAHVGDGRRLRSWRRDAGVHRAPTGARIRGRRERPRRFRPRPPVTAAAPTAPVETLTASALDEPFVPVLDPSAAAAVATTAGAADLLSCPRATFLERLAAFASRHRPHPDRGADPAARPAVRRVSVVRAQSAAAGGRVSRRLLDVEADDASAASSVSCVSCGPTAVRCGLPRRWCAD